MSRGVQIERIWRWGGQIILFGKQGVCPRSSCRTVHLVYFFFFFVHFGLFSSKSDCGGEIRAVEFSTAADLTKIKSGLLLRLRGYLKKIKMADLLIGVCLSSGQMCGESKQRRINLASHINAAASHF